MMLRKIIVISSAVMLFSWTGRRGIIEVPTHFPKPVYDLGQNDITPKSIELGRILFYDPVLSRDSTISCASCHSPYNAFSHTDHSLSHGIDDRIGRRNAPALMNLAWQGTFMWDGAIHHLDMQALAPITHPDEMGERLDHVVEKLNQSEPYRELFSEAFATDIVTGEKMLKALAHFQLTLISARSRYDQMKIGNASFTTQEKNGYKIFLKHCNSCHREPLFSNYTFKNNGLAADSILRDTGRQEVTKRAEDAMMFKVPTLRNLSYTAPYMHDGRFRKLRQVVEHYEKGIVRYPNLSEELKQPILLVDSEKTDLTAFLLTLNDSSFVFNRTHWPPSRKKP